MASVIETLERRSEGKQARGTREPRGRLTSRDLEIVRWLARVRFATGDQVARRFSLGRSQRFHVIGRLVDRGYVIRQLPRFSDGAPLLLATSSGLAKARSSLRPAFVDLRCADHDLELVELTIDYELAGAEITTERELRSLALEPGAEPGRYALALGRGSGQQFHFPDLIVCENGARQAIELEISEKTKTRLRAILRGYGRAKHFDGVTYLCERDVVVRRVAHLAKDLGVESVVEVRGYEGQVGP